MNTENVSFFFLVFHLLDKLSIKGLLIVSMQTLDTSFSCLSGGKTFSFSRFGSADS